MEFFGNIFLIFGGRKSFHFISKADGSFYRKKKKKFIKIIPFSHFVLFCKNSPKGTN